MHLQVPLSGVVSRWAVVPHLGDCWCTVRMLACETLCYVVLCLNVLSYAVNVLIDGNVACTCRWLALPRRFYSVLHLTVQWAILLFAMLWMYWYVYRCPDLYFNVLIGHFAFGIYCCWLRGFYCLFMGHCVVPSGVSCFLVFEFL